MIKYVWWRQFNWFSLHGYILSYCFFQKSSLNQTSVDTSNLKLVLIAPLTTQSLKSVQSGWSSVVKEESMHLVGFSHLNYRFYCGKAKS